MHAQPPRTLKRLLRQYGQELIDDPRRTEALLRDYCGQHTREIFVLVNAQKQRVPTELLAAPAWMPRQATYSRLSRMLQSKLALTDDAADWAVAAWANALELEAQSKQDGWSWLPGQARRATTSGGRKPRGKKRQNSTAGVQYPKRSVRNTRARGVRAEMGWGFPFPTLAVTRWFQPFKMPIAWASFTPWVALIGATIFLLAVIYWTSSARSVPTLVSPGTDGTDGSIATLSASAGQITEQVDEESADILAALELPEPPAAYLTRVMPLPTWANVSVTDAPLLIRQEPSTDAQFLNVLQNGTAVSVVAFYNDGKWAQIASPQAGWVSNDYLRYHSVDATPSAVRLGVQQLETLYATRVLAAPNATADEIATLPRAEVVIVAASVGNPVTWYQVADPVVGWVAASDLGEVAP